MKILKIILLVIVALLVIMIGVELYQIKQNNLTNEQLLKLDNDMKDSLLKYQSSFREFEDSIFPLLDEIYHHVKENK